MLFTTFIKIVRYQIFEYQFFPHRELFSRSRSNRARGRLTIVHNLSFLCPSFPLLRHIRDRLNLGCAHGRRIRTGFNADLADIHDLGQALKALEIFSKLPVTAF